MPLMKLNCRNYRSEWLYFDYIELSETLWRAGYECNLETWWNLNSALDYPVTVFVSTRASQSSWYSDLTESSSRSFTAQCVQSLSVGELLEVFKKLNCLKTPLKLSVSETSQPSLANSIHCGELSRELGRILMKWSATPSRHRNVNE